jgi:hypothetical protein
LLGMTNCSSDVLSLSDSFLTKFFPSQDRETSETAAVAITSGRRGRDAVTGSIVKGLHTLNRKAKKLIEEQ